MKKIGFKLVMMIAIPVLLGVGIVIALALGMALWVSIPFADVEEKPGGGLDLQWNWRRLLKGKGMEA